MSQRPLNPISVKYLTSLAILFYYLGSFYLPLCVIWRIQVSNKLDRAAKFFFPIPGCRKKFLADYTQIVKFPSGLDLACLSQIEREIYVYDSFLHSLPSEII